MSLNMENSPLINQKNNKEILNSKKKIFILLGGLSIIFIIILIIFLVFFNQKQTSNLSATVINKEKKSLKNELNNFSKKELKTSLTLTQTQKQINQLIDKTKDKTKNFLPIAEKTLSCLNKMKDERGVYLYSKTCETPSNCKKLDSNHSGPRPIWAWFKHYQKTKNPQDLKIISDDLENHLKKVATIQNDFWNCKLMYDAWINGNFSFDIKKKVEDLCFYGNYIYDQSLNINQTQEPDLKKTIEIKKNAPYPTETSTTTSEDILKFAFFSSDFASKYLWAKNLDDLKQAKNFFNYAVNLYTNEKKFIFIKSKCVLGIASVDLYKATKKIDYLNFAKDLYDFERVSDLCLKNDQIDAGHCRNSLYDRTTCTFFANELYLLTKEQKYKDFKDQSLIEIIEDAFDYQGYKNKILGDGCFNSYLNQSKNNKHSLENGLITGLLLSE